MNFKTKNTMSAKTKKTVFTLLSLLTASTAWAEHKAGAAIRTAYQARQAQLAKAFEAQEQKLAAKQAAEKKSSEAPIFVQAGAAGICLVMLAAVYSNRRRRASSPLAAGGPAAAWAQPRACRRRALDAPPSHRPLGLALLRRLKPRRACRPLRHASPGAAAATLAALHRAACVPRRRRRSRPAHRRHVGGAGRLHPLGE